MHETVTMRANHRKLHAVLGCLIVAMAVVGCARKPPESWQAFTIPADAIFSGICLPDSLNGWIVGGNYQIEGGIVGRTRDGGRTWRFRSGIALGKGTGYALGTVQFHDSLNGCAVTGDRILVTADGGESWRDADGAAGTNIGDLWFLDRNNGWAVG